MILKSGILRGIEDLQQRGRRVALKTSAELVDFIQHEHGISTSGLPYPLNNIPRECTDIGTPMPPNIRLVVHSPETLAHEFAIHGAHDALSKRGFSDSWRTNKAQD